MVFKRFCVWIRLRDVFNGVTDAFGEEMDPAEFLMGLVATDESWKMDLSGATLDECALWASADMDARIFRAMQQERPVRFLQDTFLGLSELPRLAAALAELDIVCVEADTPEELRIGVIKH